MKEGRDKCGGTGIETLGTGLVYRSTTFQFCKLKSLNTLSIDRSPFPLVGAGHVRCLLV